MRELVAAHKIERATPHDLRRNADEDRRIMSAVARRRAAVPTLSSVPATLPPSSAPATCKPPGLARQANAA
jgi:hypothetical protein